MIVHTLEPAGLQQTLIYWEMIWTMCSIIDLELAFGEPKITLSEIG